MALDILGALIARVHGGTLEEVVNHYITGPLGLKDSRFHVTDRERLAAAYADGAKGAIRMPSPYYPPANPAGPPASRRTASSTQKPSSPAAPAWPARRARS